MSTMKEVDDILLVLHNIYSEEASKYSQDVFSFQIMPPVGFCVVVICLCDVGITYLHSNS